MDETKVSPKMKPHSSERLERTMEDTLKMPHELEISQEVNDDIRVQINCPKCNAPHIDEGWYAIHPHKRHLCFSCKKFFWEKKATIGIQ